MSFLSSIFKPNVKKLQKENNIQELIKASTYEKDMEVRLAALKALGESRDNRVIEPLVIAMKDRNKDVVMAAINALGEIKDDRAVESLITALSHWDSKINASAADVLGETKNPKAIGPLIVSLKRINKSIKSEFESNLKMYSQLAPKISLGSTLEAKGVENADQRVAFALAGAVKDPQKTDQEKILKALALITNRDFGEDSEKWQDWFDQNKATFSDKL